jgi:phosphatidylserine decarboxylase
MSIHREGYPTLIGVGLALALATLLALWRLPRRAALAFAALSLITEGFFVQFFRNPRRVTPLRSNAVFAPADGTIVAVEPVYESEYFHDERLKVSIYMSALNVHLNRVPVDGRVVYRRYHPGRYLVAFHPKASELNERNTVVLETAAGTPVLVRQIAGLLARRITCYLEVGGSVRAGDELGFIKFGSRCDVFLPLGSEVRVQLQDTVRGGETLVATLPPNQPQV